MNEEEILGDMGENHDEYGDEDQEPLNLDEIDPELLEAA
jgi:hypothetical protein